MKASQSLKNRIAGSFVLLAFVLCSFFTLAAYTAVELAESQLIDHNFDKLATNLITQHINKITLELPPDISFYIDAVSYTHLTLPTKRIV